MDTPLVVVVRPRISGARTGWKEARRRLAGTAHARRSGIRVRPDVQGEQRHARNLFRLRHARRDPYPDGSPSAHQHHAPQRAGWVPVDEPPATTPRDQGLLLHLMLQGAEDPKAAARLGSTPALCRLGLDILSWQKLRARLPSLLPLGTKVAHKTGTGSRGYMDAGIVYRESRPLFILAAYTDGVPAALPDGMPGFAAANQVIGRMARLAWDELAR